MNRQLLGYAIWVLIALIFLVIFTIFQGPWVQPSPAPVPQGGTRWLVSFLISWLPFFFLVCVWILLVWWMRAGQKRSVGKGAALSAPVLNDPAHWRACADEARAAAEQFADTRCKQHMLEIARGYEYVAQRVEETRRGSDNPT